MYCWTWLNNITLLLITPVIAKPTQLAPDEGDSRLTE